MYRNAVYVPREQAIKLFTWDESGKRVMHTVSFNPYLYLEDPKGTKTSIYGTKLKKKVFPNSYERNNFIKSSGIKRLFENLPVQQQYLLDVFWQENEKPAFSINPLRVVYIDIETYSPSSEGFPDVDNPTHPVNVITCYDSIDRQYYTFGTKQISKKFDNVNYIYCKTERELFVRFLEYLEKDYPDVITGWNSEFFDIPYIINRIERILGQDYVNKLSPLGRVSFRMITGKFGREQKRYFIDGVASIDYLDIYKRFCLKLRESYKLDAIGEIELGERKVDYGYMDLATLADTDWDKFIEYNVQDVKLVIRLEEKLQYISLLRMLSYVGLTTLEGAMGTLSVINGALTIRARKRDEIISTFIRAETSGKNPGAYVAEPKSGFKTNVVSFDANSLYPNIMISLNLSPETKIGRVEKTALGNINVYHVSGKCFELTPNAFNAYLKAEECSISKAGILFSQKKKGILPEFLDYYYNERVIIRSELFKAKQKLGELIKGTKEYTLQQYEIERLNTKQMVIKILVNSAYGYTGNKQAPIGDDDIAASVTLTGQAVIKQSNTLVKEFIKSQIPDITEHELEECIIYNDTDSTYISIAPLVARKLIRFYNGKEVHDEAYAKIKEVGEYLNTHINEWAKKALRTKDPRFVFKRESISDAALFLQKKRYVMHILDDEGIKVDKFKYTGVEVVRTTMPNAIKPYAKRIIETMLMTQSLKDTNAVVEETYKIFKDLPPEDIAFVMGVKGYEKYAIKCKDLNIATRTPIHVRSAYLHNHINRKLSLSKKYEDISSGDKVRYLYVEQPNKFGVDVIGFKYNYPDEYKELFRIDYNKMFEKILFAAIDRFYTSVNWQIRKPTEQVTTELFDLFAL